MSQPPEQGRERPARYPRTFGGLLAAMVATVLFIAGYVGFRAVTRDQPDIQPEVDYASCVSLLQEAGVDVVHPSALPDGWRSTAVHFERGEAVQWRLATLTADDEFVGVVQQAEDVDDLLEEYVDAAPDQGDDAAPTNGLGIAAWETWSDDGGDRAFSAVPESGPLAGQTVLVYGSAPVADQQELIGLLTLDPVEASSTGCDTDALS